MAITNDPRVLAIDAGGTMTDTFIVDDQGSFVVGEAQTTPDDESVGLMHSAEDALRRVGFESGRGLSAHPVGRVLGHGHAEPAADAPGRRVGAIVTAGQEDGLQMERGVQTYLGYSYADRLHIATHHHNEPSSLARV